MVMSTERSSPHDGEARAADQSVASRLSPGLSDRVRIVVRPIGSPLALGFMALAAASFVSAGYDLAWVNRVENARAVALILLAVPVPLQFLSAVVGLAARDPVAAAGMGMLSATWLATGLVTLVGPAGGTSPALGLLLLAAAGALLVPTVVAVATKRLAGLAMGTAAVRFCLAGVAELTGELAWRDAAGGCGVALAAIAVCAAFGFETESVYGHAVPPTGRRGPGRRAVSGSLNDQLADMEHESGVRQAL